MTTHQTDPQYKLRMPPELRDKLKDAAKENHRTMNAEIVARLQESFEGTSATGSGSELQELQRKLDAQDEVLTEAMRMLRKMSLQTARSASDKESSDDTDR